MLPVSPSLPLIPVFLLTSLPRLLSAASEGSMESLGRVLHRLEKEILSEPLAPLTPHQLIHVTLAQIVQVGECPTVHEQKSKNKKQALPTGLALYASKPPALGAASCPLLSGLLGGSGSPVSLPATGWDICFGARLGGPVYSPSQPPMEKRA